MRKFQCLIFLVLVTSGCVKKNETAGEDTSSETTVPKDMVLIPSGTFMMGARSEQASYDEYPRHEVVVTGFYMDKHEVTNAQFKAFVDATGYQTVAERDIDWEELKKQVPEGTPKPADSVLKAGSLVFRATQEVGNLNDYSRWWKWTIGASWQHPQGPDSDINNIMHHPVVHIAWEDAVAYAVWAGKRLPTEAEWEWAASGGNPETTYPWGDDPTDLAHDKANFWQGTFPVMNLESDGYYGTAPVGSFPPNEFGLYDMAGNVWEWCQDKYNLETYQTYQEEGLVKDPAGATDYYDPREPLAPKHVIRGGSFLCNDSYCSGYRISRRMSSSKDSGFNHTGFRCVKDVK